MPFPRPGGAESSQQPAVPLPRRKPISSKITSSRAHLDRGHAAVSSIPEDVVSSFIPMTPPESPLPPPAITTDDVPPPRLTPMPLHKRETSQRAPDTPDNILFSASPPRLNETVPSLLESLGLSAFTSAVTAEGFETEDDLLELTEESARELGVDIGMKRGHLIRFLRWLRVRPSSPLNQQRIKGQNADVAEILNRMGDMERKLAELAEGRPNGSGIEGSLRKLSQEPSMEPGLDPSDKSMHTIMPNTDNREAGRFNDNALIASETASDSMIDPLRKEVAQSNDLIIQEIMNVEVRAIDREDALRSELGEELSDALELLKDVATKSDNHSVDREALMNRIEAIERAFNAEKQSARMRDAMAPKQAPTIDESHQHEWEMKMNSRFEAMDVKTTATLSSLTAQATAATEAAANARAASISAATAAAASLTADEVGRRVEALRVEVQVIKAAAAEASAVALAGKRMRDLRAAGFSVSRLRLIHPRLTARDCQEGGYPASEVYNQGLLPVPSAAECKGMDVVYNGTEVRHGTSTLRTPIYAKVIGEVRGGDILISPLQGSGNAACLLENLRLLEWSSASVVDEYSHSRRGNTGGRSADKAVTFW